MRLSLFLSEVILAEKAKSRDEESAYMEIRCVFLSLFARPNQYGEFTAASSSCSSKQNLRERAANRKGSK